MQHKAFPILLINSIFMLGNQLHRLRSWTPMGFFWDKATQFLTFLHHRSWTHLLFHIVLEEIAHKVMNARAKRYRTSAWWRWRFSEKERSTPKCTSFLFNESGPFQKGGLIFPVALLMLVWRFKLERKPTLKSHDSININILFKCIISDRIFQMPYYVTWLLK